MQVNPVYTTLKKIFHSEVIYTIPKYQRGYAWEKSEINDFLNDLETCYKARKSTNDPTQYKKHFFGGIVSVKHDIIGVSEQHRYEIVDGQQRMATFVMLASVLINEYAKHLDEIDQDTKNKIGNRIKKLKERFIEFEQEVHLESKKVNVLSLSKADKTFFDDIIKKGSEGIQHNRESHKRVKSAYKAITYRVEQIIQEPDVIDRLTNLQTIEHIIDDDFQVLHIVAQNINEAYTLFQVLNNRGKSLTEGDLLRAETLKLLENFEKEQEIVEGLWDNILADSFNKTRQYLRWIYVSCHYLSPGTNTLYDDFLAKFYPEHKYSKIESEDAKKITSTTQIISDEVQFCRKLTDGEWPYSHQQPITAWDRDRLDLLITGLKHTLCIPLLVAATKLDHRKFSNIIQILERFVFRYINAAKKHAGPLDKVYAEEAEKIRRDPAQYNVSNLINALIPLQANVSDELFKTSLDGFEYSRKGGGNKPLKYFLMTVEHYYRWYKDGANGQPQCLDKTRVYDFKDTTIEHIYPYNASGSVFNNDLDKLKNTIGNLTFMGPKDNNTGGDKSFVDKKLIFKASSVTLNQEIAQETLWDKSTVEKQANKLKDIACKIFKI